MRRIEEEGEEEEGRKEEVANIDKDAAGGSRSRLEDATNQLQDEDADLQEIFKKLDDNAMFNGAGTEGDDAAGNRRQRRRCSPFGSCMGLI